MPELAPPRRLLGLIAFGDAIKPTAIGAVSALRTAGIRTLQAALMSGASCTRPERARSPRRDGASNGRVVAQQMTEAFPWDTAPRYLVRDRDAVHGHVVRQRLRGLGIPGSTDGATIALAKRLCGAFDRFDTARVP